MPNMLSNVTLVRVDGVQSAGCGLLASLAVAREAAARRAGRRLLGCPLCLETIRRPLKAMK